MAKRYFIYSTLSGDNLYQNYGKGGADLPVAEGGVLIHGGANVPDKKLITPLGVMTEVSADELTYLQANEVFKVHEKNGFLKVSEKKADPDVVAADMETRDPSAPVVPADFEAEGLTAPVVNAAPEPEAKPAAGNSRRA